MLLKNKYSLVHCTETQRRTKTAECVRDCDGMTVLLSVVSMSVCCQICALIVAFDCD